MKSTKRQLLQGSQMCLLDKREPAEAVWSALPQKTKKRAIQILALMLVETITQPVAEEDGHD